MNVDKDQVSAGLVLLNAGFAVHNGDWNYKDVNSPFARIYSVKEGTAVVHLPGKSQVLLPGHLYLIPPFVTHSYECDGHFVLYYIHVYEPSDASGKLLEDYVFPVEVDASAYDVCLVERLMEVNPERQLKEYDPSDYDNPSTLLQSIRRNLFLAPAEILETQGILMQLLSRFLRKAVHMHDITDDRIWKSIRYIRRNMDKEITLEMLSGMSCLSKDHFIRLFRKEMKTTPSRYINRKKIEQAQLMLFAGNTPVKDIAYSLAFNNLSYFDRLFKRIVGCTPMEYRNGNFFRETRPEEGSHCCGAAGRDESDM